MKTFIGTPDMLVRLRQPIGTLKHFRFNENGHFSTDNPKLITRIGQKFEELVTVESFVCNKCEFTTDNKGLLMSHYRKDHPKGDQNE